MWARLIALVACAACDTSLSEYPQIYSRPNDGPITCGMNIDNKNLVSVDAIGTGLDRAAVEGEIIHVYSHQPAGTIDESTIEEVVAAASDRGMPFVTYADLANGTATYGLAYSFDDRDIIGWHQLLPMFRYYGARVTFFISAFHALDENERRLLREIADAGHAIEYHSTFHLNAETVAAEMGVAGYIETDILPGLMHMREAGFDPHAFAYPFGARTAATDRAILEILPAIRASHFNCPR
ncbi:MAG: polysaccharide deacetylase family protein [Myxococcota bacterium]|nr:polysaccharide deacetylase family protein [Myxococcota bacterium]